MLSLDVCLFLSYQSVVSCSPRSPSSRPGTEQVLIESLVDRGMNEQKTNPEHGGGRDPCRGTPLKPTLWQGPGMVCLHGA